MVTDHTDERLLSPLKRQLSGFATEVQQMLRARAELLGLELQAARASGTRLAVALIVGSLSALIALPVAAVALAFQIARWFELDSLSLLWIFTAVLLIVAAGLIFGGWRRYRREFTGLEDSIAELHEDMVWLREWLGTEAAANADAEDDTEGPESTSEASAESAAMDEENDQEE